jgi:glycosyltransferase involved in cell wall biosynthesis
VPISDAKVVHCFRAPIGGLFRHVRDLVSAQHALGMRVGVICDSGGDSGTGTSLATLASRCALGVHRVPMRREPSPADFRTIGKIARTAARLQPDIIHGHGAKGAAYARLAAHRVGARAICTPHGGWLHYPPWSLRGATYGAMERALNRLAHGVIFESAFSRDTFARRLGPPRCPQAVIHNGLPEEEFTLRERAPRPYDFVFVGELRELKGIATLLDAIALLGPRHPDCRVLVAGDGPDAERFRLQSRRLGLEGAVRFAGPVFPSARAFAEGRFAVVPSRAESLPYVVLEAMAAGMPVIATRVGGIPEIFGPRADDLVPPGDARALAGKMAAMLDDPVRAERDALDARAFVQARFSLDAMASGINAFYEQVLNA